MSYEITKHSQKEEPLDTGIRDDRNKVLLEKRRASSEGISDQHISISICLVSYIHLSSIDGDLSATKVGGDFVDFYF